MLYFTADTHFWHHNVIKMSRRPFNSLNEMHAALITNWNSVVAKTDEVYILGDFAYKGQPQQVNQILGKLNGKKYLVRGNHDRYLDQPDFDLTAFEWVKDYDVISYKDARFVLFHYPILEWAHYHRKSAHLYGHVHNNVSHDPELKDRFAVLGQRAINVGVDCNDLRPIGAEEVYSRAFDD